MTPAPTARTVEQRLAALEAMLRPAETAPRRRAPRIAEIVRACAAAWDVPVETIYSPRRARKYARPRQVAMFLARELGDHSFIALGRAFGRDHSTVMYGHAQVAALRARNPDFAARVDALAHVLTNPDSQEATRP